MTWTPLNYIVTIAACTIIVVPIVSFFVAGLIGAYFKGKREIADKLNEAFIAKFAETLKDPSRTEQKHE